MDTTIVNAIILAHFTIHKYFGLLLIQLLVTLMLLLNGNAAVISNSTWSAVFSLNKNGFVLNGGAR